MYNWWGDLAVSVLFRALNVGNSNQENVLKQGREYELKSVSIKDSQGSVRNNQLKSISIMVQTAALEKAVACLR